MENKRTKKALDDETLGQVTGGTNGGDRASYQTKNVKKDENDPIYKMIVNMMTCPNMSDPLLPPHGKLDCVLEGEIYDCNICGIRWVIAK